MRPSAGSVWADTDRARFQDDIRKLHAQECSGPVTGHNRRSRADTQNHAGSHVSNGLPFSVEKSLADHFAFLAAWQTTPGLDTAATVTATSHPPGLLVTLAGNGLIPSEVRAALGHVAYRLQQCAQNGNNGRRSTAVQTFNLGPSAIPRDKAAEQCLREVALLHRQRIFARLGSSKGVARPSSWPSNATVDISSYLRDQLVQLRTRQSLKPRAGLSSLIARLERLSSSLRECETALGELETYCLTAMLQDAHDLFEAGLPLLRKLMPECIESLEFRQLRALGYYWRMCKHLVECATSCRKIFKRIHLEPLLCPPAETWRSVKHSAHPEVQLLIHHESQSVSGGKDQTKPRYVGTSRRPCFLCHSFVTASGRYGVTGSHGEVDPLWTCPDSEDFDPRLRGVLASALQHTAVAARQAVKASTRDANPRPRKACKMEAASKLFGEELPPHPGKASKSVSELTKAQSASDGRSHSSRHRSTASSRKSKSHCGHSSEETLVATPDAIVRNLTPGKIQRVSCAKSEVYVSLEGGKDILAKRDSQASAACSFGSSDTLYDKAHSSIDISRIVEGEEITLTKEDLAKELILELRLDKVQTCRLRLQWEAG